MLKSKVHRLSHHQAQRKNVYCVEKYFHITVTDPLHPYSGDPHTLEFAECDCEAKSTPSTPKGEEDDHGTQTSYGGTDSDSEENANGISGQANQSSGAPEGNPEQGERDGEGEPTRRLHEDGRHGWNGEVGSKTSH